MHRQQEEEEKRRRMEAIKEKGLQKKKEQVGSRLTEETKAMQEKKRAKFDGKEDKGRDAMTMGGNILGVQARAMPFWR